MTGPLGARGGEQAWASLRPLSDRRRHPPGRGRAVPGAAPAKPQGTNAAADGDARDRERAVAFLRDVDQAVAGELLAVSVEDGARRPSPAVVQAVLDRRRPLVWDANYVWVQDASGAGAGALSRAAEGVLGAAGLDHRLVVVADPRQGRALAGEFRAMGWQERPYLIMVHRDRALLSPPGPAREISARTALEGRRRIILDEPWGTPAVADQILSRDALIEQTAGGRCFGVQVGGRVASHCQLFARGDVGQVENVSTQLAHRNRGLAQAVVSLATAVAHQQAKLVFLCADAHDWPQQLYRRLGYEPVGLLHRFCPTLPGQVVLTR